jgi:hypothetical protein
MLKADPPRQDVIAGLIDKIRAYDDLTGDDLGRAAIALSITDATSSVDELASWIVVHLVRAAREPDWRRIAIRCWELDGREEISRQLEPGQFGALMAAVKAEQGPRA